MGFLQRIRDELHKRTAPRPFEEVIAHLDSLGLGGTSKSGVRVSFDTALQVTAVLACIRVIADGCATPPMRIVKKDADGRKTEQFDRTSRVLTARPNQWQTSFEFRRMLTMHSALAGAGYALKVKVGSELRELIPIMPQHVDPRNDRRYDFEWRVTDEFGPIGTFTDQEIFRLPNLQWKVIQEMPAVRLARDAIGLSIASEDSQARLHKNGARPGGVLTTEQTLSDERLKRVKSAWALAHGEDKKWGTGVLDGGWKWLPMTMTGVDAQHLETRRHQIEEIARAFNVFPQIIMQTLNTSTHASAESFFAAHMRQTVAPWIQLWGRRLDEFCLDGAGPITAEFITRELTKASMKDRGQFYRTVAEMGIYTRNEIREMEGLEPIDGLDEPLTPLNMRDGETDEDEPAPEITNP